MRLFLTVLALLLFAQNSQSAVISSSQAGNWADPATWVGRAVPEAGDCAIITHAVTVSGSHFVGASPANRTTFDLNVTGKLIMSRGSSLTVYGNSYFNHGRNKATSGVGLEMASGSTLITSNARGAKLGYKVQLGQYNVVRVRGDSHNRAVITGAAGEAGHLLMGVNAGANTSWDADYLDIVNFTGGFTVYLSNAANAAGATFLHTRWLGNGATNFLATEDTRAALVLEDCLLRDAKSGVSSRALFRGKKGHHGLTIRRCVFMDQLTFAPPSGWGVTESYCNNVVQTNFDPGTVKAQEGLRSFSGNLVRFSTTTQFEGDIYNSYIVNDYTLSNGGALNWRQDTASHTIKGTLFELVTSSTGDLVSPNMLAGGPARAPVFNNNILLPAVHGCSPGKIISFWNSSLLDSVKSLSLTMDNNTFVSCAMSPQNPETGLGLGEFVPPVDSDEKQGNHAGLIASFRNNLVWSPPGLNAAGGNKYPQGGFKVVRWNSTVQDLLRAADADFNWGWNLSPGNEGRGYHPYSASPRLFSKGTPDLHGGNLNPGFVDRTRNLATYDTARLGHQAPAWTSGTSFPVGAVVSSSDPGVYGGAKVNWRCVKAHLSRLGDAVNGKPVIAPNWRANWEFASHQRIRDDLSLIADLIAWVKGGFAPGNPLLKGAGYGGQDIGAVPVALTHPAKPGIAQGR
jgi:hypothetical protein